MTLPKVDGSITRGSEKHVDGIFAVKEEKPGTALGRVLGRALLRWNFRLFGYRRLRRVVLENVEGRPIQVLPTVFNPRLFRSGAFLARALNELELLPSSSVLDLGTGTGIAAIIAATRARDVVAVDVNPEAIRCARINVLLNRVEDRVDVREGDLFGPIGSKRFNLVIFNPPYYRGVPRDDADRAWRSVDVVERFARELADHLAPDGQALVVLSTDGESFAYLDELRRCNFTIDVAARRSYLNETFTLYRLSRRG